MYRFWLVFSALLLLQRQTTQGQVESDEAGEFEIAMRLLHSTLFQQVVSANENIGFETRTIFEDDLREFMEFVRLQMPCGYPPAGIPPLVPLHADYKDVNVVLNKTEIHGNVTDLNISGLDEFDVQELHFSNILHKVRYDFRFPEILITGNYMTNITTRMYGPKFHIYGDGILHLTLKNLRIYGSFIVRPKNSGSLKLRKFKATVELGDVESKLTGILGSALKTKLFNDWIEEFIDMTLNDNQEEVSELLENWAEPRLNRALDEVSVIGVVALILGIIDGSIMPQEPLC
ncbi:PREDICTED: uncharacterized protein LOC108368013 [Rhagoletis zephyria]|uniref:uncharacterized protein LOC108368013 n=1 Tax=Rhagoletis zephyria TaxID=28612 RepID=UPI0008118569|nr:PREDICTED: uncharacterized protein LOC108368013 [Rhagoletis zephyria]